MAEEKIDDILVRVDEIEKLQAELRHLVPRVTSNSSRQARHQGLSRDSSTSIRFPSLFTFPVISNFTSSPKNERVQKSAAQLNLRNKLSSGNRSSTVNLKNAGRPLTSTSFAKERNMFKDLIKSSNNIAKLHRKNSLASTSGINSKTSVTPMKNVASRIVKNSQDIIKKGLKSETSKITPKNKIQHVISERPNMRLGKTENTNSTHSSVQRSDIQTQGKMAKSGSIWSYLKRNRRPDKIPTLIERIIEKLNYCFLNDKRMTVPCNHPGTRIPRRRVQVSSIIEGT